MDRAGIGKGSTLTRTPPGRAPLLFFNDEALQPRERPARFSAKCQLQVEDVACLQAGFAELDSLAVDFEEGQDQRVGDVAVEEPGGFVGFAEGLVVRAESAVGMSVAKARQVRMGKRE